ncbi:MAG: hypothetical protein AB7G28_25685 [Pirellulales bacterium]
MPIALGATAIQQLTISQAGRDLVAAVDAAGQREALQLGHTVTSYSTGVATLTNTLAALDFSGTDAVVVLDQPGKWKIMAGMTFYGQSFGADVQCPVKLRRTNNTAGDLGASSVNYNFASQYADGVLILPTCIYETENSNDSITIFGMNPENEGEIKHAWVVAERIQ